MKCDRFCNCPNCARRWRIEARKERKRAEKAERERDEARSQAVWAKPCGFGTWIVEAPGGRLLYEEGRSSSKFWARPKSVDLMAMRFDSEAEALAAGRAVPWWEVQP